MKMVILFQEHHQDVNSVATLQQQASKMGWKALAQPARGAGIHTNGGVGVAEAGAIFSELVEVGRLEDGMTVATEAVASLLVRCDEDNVWFHRDTSCQGFRQAA
mgnify:CR=1 FL=1